MGFDALVAALERDAAAAGEQLLKTAEAEAHAIRQAAEARVAREREARRLDSARRHAVVAGARVATATRAARLRILEAQRAWLEAVRVESEAALAALPATRWSPAIPELVTTALRYAGSGPVTIRCQHAASAAVTAVTASRTGTTVRGVAEMEPGVILASDDGRLEVPLTTASRLAIRWPDLQLALLARLEAER